MQSAMPQIEARGTLRAMEVVRGEPFRFVLTNGQPLVIELLDTGAEIIETNLEEPGAEQPGAMTTYRFWGEFRVNGREFRLEREVGTSKTFYEPWVIDGARIWLDAVDDIFDFMNETHGPCRLQKNCSYSRPPRRHARIAVQDASARICPEKIHPWCPLPEDGLNIEDCYRGEDCWLGAYDGASAHGGLDINHPTGTSLYAPIRLDDHFLYNATAMGHRNNRWRGLRSWPDGSQWVLTSCHMTKLTVPEHQPLDAGQHYAEGAGVMVGAAEHSHFAFAVFDRGELTRLDPWILFWQMYQDTT
jgi:hypothetical protein